MTEYIITFLFDTENVHIFDISCHHLKKLALSSALVHLFGTWVSSEMRISLVITCWRIVELCLIIAYFGVFIQQRHRPTLIQHCLTPYQR